MPPETFPLTRAKPGASLRLIEIRGGKEANHRLLEMGLVPGVQLSILQDTGGPLLVAVGPTRLALGRGIASKVFVSTIEK